MVEGEKETIIVEESAPRVERETTVISTGGGGGGGALAAIVIVLVVVLLLFLYFSGYLGRAADEVDVNVNIEAPKIEAPDIDINLPPPSQPANSNKQ
jgi:hypothetical protein